MRRLNYQVDGEHRDVATVVREFFKVRDHPVVRASPPLEEGWLREAQTEWSGRPECFSKP
jgi:hypothetical protein